VRAVARRARVSVAGLYYYVSSKAELLYLLQYHAFDSLVERYKHDSATVREPEARLELFVRNHLKHFLGNLPELSICSRELDRLAGPQLARIQERQREYFGLLVRLLIELREKHGGARVSPRVAALALFGSINWVYTWYRPGVDADAATLAADIVQLYLHGNVPGLPMRPRATWPLGAARAPRSTEGAVYV
jgi:AcrR family transcriptional regulator